MHGVSSVFTVLFITICIVTYVASFGLLRNHATSSIAFLKSLYSVIWSPIVYMYIFIALTFQSVPYRSVHLMTVLLILLQYRVFAYVLILSVLP
jgi:hypothetical protein